MALDSPRGVGGGKKWSKKNDKLKGGGVVRHGDVDGLGLDRYLKNPPTFHWARFKQWAIRYEAGGDGKGVAQCSAENSPANIILSDFSTNGYGLISGPCRFLLWAGAPREGGKPVPRAAAILMSRAQIMGKLCRLKKGSALDDARFKIQALNPPNAQAGRFGRVLVEQVRGPSS